MSTPYTATIDNNPVTTAALLPVVNPATEEIFAHAPDCGAEELNTAVAAARAAFPAWRDTAIAIRQDLVRQLGQAISAQRSELSRLLTQEQGKPHPASEYDIDKGVAWCEYYSQVDLPVEIAEDNEKRRLEVRRTPLGVVGALAPWNFPVTLALMKAAPALVAGNTVILKPSPFTPSAALRIGEIAREILPAGILNVISGGDQLGPLMTKHPGIDKISFTGSTATGRRVMESASHSLKRVTLELGGNDAAIILPDVDVDKVAQQIFAAAFGNSGQICVAVKRLYIHEDIYDRFSAALVKLVKAAKVGDGSKQGTQFGPVQNHQQYAPITGLIEDAKAQGYNFLIGGDEIERPGYFLPLTLIDNPPEHSRIVREEQFGPILPLLKWRDEADVIARANDSEYGLGGQVWSADENRAYEIGLKLEAGTVFINQPQQIDSAVPFGGHKQSGLGVESALDGLLAFTNSQTVMVKKAPAVFQA